MIPPLTMAVTHLNRALDSIKEADREHPAKTKVDYARTLIVEAIEAIRKEKGK